MATGTKATIDHDKIKAWAEDRNAWPARVKGTGGRGDVGMIRLDFPGYSGKDSLAKISWEDFFAKFEEMELALAYRDRLASGGRSNFNKLVGRETVAVEEGTGRKTGMARRRAKQAGVATGRVGAGRRGTATKRGRATKQSGSKAARSAQVGSKRRRAAPGQGSAKRGGAAESPRRSGARAKAQGGSRRGGASRKASSSARNRRA